MSRVFPPPRTPPAGPWAETAVRRLRDGRLHDEIDHLALEAPLEIRLGGQAFTVLMRTPGHDEELGAKWEVRPIPEDLVEQAEMYRADMLETVVGVDEALMEKYGFTE